MSDVWKTVWHEPFDNKVLTTLAVLSIAVGMFALGLVRSLRDALQAWMPVDYRWSNAGLFLF